MLSPFSVIFLEVSLSSQSMYRAALSERSQAQRDRLLIRLAKVWSILLYISKFAFHNEIKERNFEHNRKSFTTRSIRLRRIVNNNEVLLSFAFFKLTFALHLCSSQRWMIFPCPSRPVKEITPRLLPLIGSYVALFISTSIMIEKKMRWRASH